MVIFEACVDTLESAIAAERGGAHRIELCANLLEGGTTPSYGMIKVVTGRLRIPVYVLIRPRAGDFVYSTDELEIMMDDIRVAKRLGAQGVVFGILTARGEVDAAKVRLLVELSQQLSLDVTFHRAFDVSCDPMKALEVLVELGIGRVLTSGQAPTAGEGVPLLRALVEAAAGRISIMPGGGLSDGNAAEIVRTARVKELHGSARVARGSQMERRHHRCPMRATSLPGEDEIFVTSEDKVCAIVEAANGGL